MIDRLRPPARHVWRVLETLSMAAGLGAGAILCLVWLPFAVPLYALLPRWIGQPVGRFVIMAGCRIYLRFLSLFCGFRFDLDALDPLRRDGPLVVVANHPSLLDAVMIVSRFPDMVCVMKAALMDNILLGSAARLARYIPNNAPLDIVLRARLALREGSTVLIFPEGTRTANFPIDACTASAGLIAQRANAPVQCLLIEFDKPYLGKSWPLWRRPELPQHFRIRVGRRFAPPRDVADFGRELEAYFRAELGPSSTTRPAPAAAPREVTP